MNFLRNAISIAMLIAAFFLHGCSSNNYSSKNQIDQNPQAKNVILMITDGASWGTWDMASYWEYGERGRQPYDQFDIKLGMITPPLNTYNTPTFTGISQVTYDPERAWDTTPVNTTTNGNPNYFAGYEYLKKDYTDSAAAGTVLATGQKTYNNAINYDDFSQPLIFITQEIHKQGKATGVVSSVPFSHATPAAFGAQNISRKNYGEIATFMVQGNHLDLIMGCGHPEYDSDGQPSSEPGYANETGPGGGYIPRTIWEGLRNGTAGRDRSWQLIEDKSDFEALAAGTLPLTKSRLIGIPRVYDTLQYNRTEAVMGTDAANPSGVAFNPNVPSLETMTRGALTYLSQNPNGFFLMVEGGAVDWAAHANDTARIIEEQMDFNRSVAAVVEWVEQNSSWDETLVIVLTDHGNGMPMGPDSDTIPFQPIQNNGAGVLPGVRWHFDNHTNENTLMFAHGAGAEYFYDMVIGTDAGLRDIIGFNDGRYIDNSAVHRVIFHALNLELTTP